MRRALAFAALVLAVGAACASFGSGNDATPAPDGGAESAAPPPPADAAPDADAGPWCARQTGLLFCDDFDDGPLGAKWDRSYVAVGTLALDPNANSPPNALLATLPAASSGVPQMALYKAFGGLQPRRVTIGVDVFVEAFDDAGAPADVAHVSIFSGALFYTLTVNDGANGPLLAEDTNTDGGIPQNVHRIGTKLPHGRWTRVSIDGVIRPDAGPPLVTVAFDGAQVLTDNITPTVSEGGVIAVAGMWTADVPTGGWTVRFDNYALSAE